MGKHLLSFAFYATAGIAMLPLHIVPFTVALFAMVAYGIVERHIGREE